MTALPNQRERAERAGVDALLEKPFNPLLLLETMKHRLAESDRERLERLTNPSFTAAFLAHRRLGLASGGA